MYKKLLIYIFLSISILNIGSAQKPYVQVQTSGGLTLPLMDLADPFHFCENGWNANLGFSMFFGKFGVMAKGGFQQLPASASFDRFISDKYKENFRSVSAQQWKNAFGMIGPVGKFTMGRFDLDIFGQIGMANLSVPNLLFTKRFLGQQAEIANYYGKNDQLIPFWTAGFTLHARVFKGLHVFAEPSFLTNKYLSNTLTTFRYVNANDINGNGYIDDVEYTEAEIVKNVRDMVFSNINLNVGVSYQIGRTPKKSEPVPMISLDENQPAEIPEKKDEPLISAEVKTENNKDLSSEKQETEDKTFSETRPTEPVIAQNTEGDTQARSSQSGYDAAEAGFLYKAGELYFQSNNFENAVACFNKLKNDPDYTIAKYMFALSMCEMLNCDEAATEYADFEKKYKNSDAGVLYTVFKSHHEKCKKNVVEQQALAEKLKNAEMSTESDDKTIAFANFGTGWGDQKIAGNNNSATSNQAMSDKRDIEYKIQFVALRISNKPFPRMENVGTISHEFYPKKSMYRYILGPYQSEDEAVSEMLKVRAMGFEDAFLAEYKKGVRTNTLYHAR
jgi:hypothetical protein